MEENIDLRKYESVKRKELEYLEMQINHKIECYEKENHILREDNFNYQTYHHPLDFEDLYTRMADKTKLYKELMAEKNRMEIEKNEKIETLEENHEQLFKKYSTLDKNSKKEIEILRESLRIVR